MEPVDIFIIAIMVLVLGGAIYMNFIYPKKVKEEDNARKDNK